MLGLPPNCVNSRDTHLILGGGGFIGRHVAILLARAGRPVLIADRSVPSFRFPVDVLEQIEWRRVELASADWDDLVENISVVHHYAWSSIPASANSNPAGDLTSNVISLIGLLEALRRRGQGRIVFASSGGTVYGKLHQIPVNEDHPLQPVTAYGAGKVAAEVYLGLYRSLYGIDSRIARISNPYGVGQDVTRGQGAATKFLNCALMNEPIVIWGDGEIVRDYIHITDVARALTSLSCAPKRDDFYIYNIGSGSGVSLNEIVTELETRLQKKLEVRREPARPFDIPVSVLNVSRAREVLGWKPALSLAEGFGHTMSDITNGSSFSSFECR